MRAGQTRTSLGQIRIADTVRLCAAAFLTEFYFIVNLCDVATTRAAFIIAYSVLSPMRSVLFFPYSPCIDNVVFTPLIFQSITGFV